MKYEVIDFHCDALSKMQFNDHINFQKDSRLDVDLEKLKQGNISLQCFAIYISERLGSLRFSHVLDQIHIFREKVVRSGIRPLCWQEEMDQSFTGQPWGLLSLEGADGLEANLQYLRIGFEQGIRFLGITWNYANWAADGILEPRNGGFTKKGLELIQACHDLGIILDVSHLSVKGFWELATKAKQADKPFIASHSNAYRICPHPRNLHDEQIKAIINLEGRIGLTFFPNFVKTKGPVQLLDLLRHIEHICSLGGEQHLMFGSDFDGIDTYISGLENAARYPSLVSELLKHYPEALVRRWLFGNAESFLRIHLPKRKKTL
ncbi:Membrane dipeptidase [compost metagenome]